MHPHLAVPSSASWQKCFSLIVRKAGQQLPVFSVSPGAVHIQQVWWRPRLWEVPVGGLHPGAFLVAQCMEHIILVSSHFVCSDWENVDKHYCACQSPAEAFLGVL